MLKLKEVLWEITLKCSKGCKYCGSKDDLRSTNPGLAHLTHMANEIGSYGVEVVTLTGGEPGELDSETIERVLDILKSYNCDVRVVTNGRVLRYPDSLLKKFNMIGLSVNYPVDFFMPSYLSIIPYKDLVMITNFGTHNIWDFDKLAEIAKGFKSWQIQLTTGNEYLLNPEGISYLRNKIRSLEGVKYVLADNLQDEHKCSAGINTCSITVDGDVIPCLQERSLPGGLSIQDNLFKTPLKTIWETKFREMRFADDGWCNSCRKKIEYPKIDKLTPTVAPPEKVKRRGGEVPDKNKRPYRSRLSLSQRERSFLWSNGLEYSLGK